MLQARISRLLSRLRSRAMVGSIATGIMGQIILVASGVAVARTLGPENRGVLALVLVLSSIATQVGSLGVPASVTYWIAAKKARPSSLLRGLRGFRRIQLVVILTVQAALILIVLEPRSPSGFVWVGLLSLAVTASSLSQMYGLAVLQGLSRFSAFNVLRILGGMLYMVGVVALWVMNEATLTSITLVVIGTSIIAAVINWLVVVHAAPTGKVNGVGSTRSIVSFGVRSFFGSSSPFETFRLDQLLVGVLLAPVALGYYVVGLAFTSLTRLIGQSIGMVTYPRVAGATDRATQLRILRHHFALGAAVAGSLTVILFAVVPWLLPIFFGPAFDSARTVAQILLAAAFFASIRRILVDGTRGSGWPIWGSLAELVTLTAVPIVVVLTSYTNSLAAVALVVAGANLIALLTIAPALLGIGYHDDGFLGRESHEADQPALSLRVAAKHSNSARGNLSPPHARRSFREWDH
jgi:O-antigen/teichoic acid export membrane protein